MGYSPQAFKKLDTTEEVCTHISDVYEFSVYFMGFPGGASGKNPSANSGDMRDTGSIPRPGGSLGGGHGNPLQYSCLENPRTEEPGELQSVGSQRVGHN